MPPPPICVYLTTIASQPALRQRQEYVLRTLQGYKIPFTAFDLASDEDAKKTWRRRAPPTKQQLPGILVGGEYPGSFDEFEAAAENNELHIFLRQKETDWGNDEILNPTKPVPEPKPIGVPGAVMPLQMTPERLRSKIVSANALASSPLRPKTTGVSVNKRMKEIDVGEELNDFGLQGLKVTEDELATLVSDLGLDGDLAQGLLKGLGSGVANEERNPAKNFSTAVNKDKQVVNSTDTKSEEVLKAVKEVLVEEKTSTTNTVTT